MRDRYIAAIDPSVECIHEPRHPCLECLALFSVFGAHPISQLGNDHSARVASILFFFEPGNDPTISVPFGGLANNVSVQ